MRCAWLHESAEAGNGLAENQVLHLEGALVGVEASASTKNRPTLYSAAMPLPPSSSRAHATVSRHLAVVKALARDACASVILPSACNWDMRTKRHCEAVMLASILARRSCTIWNEPIGLPNCNRSWQYLTAFS